MNDRHTVDCCYGCIHYDDGLDGFHTCKLLPSENEKNLVEPNELCNKFEGWIRSHD